MEESKVVRMQGLNLGKGLEAHSVGNHGVDQGPGEEVVFQGFSMTAHHHRFNLTPYLGSEERCDSWKQTRRGRRAWGYPGSINKMVSWPTKHTSKVSPDA